MLFRGAWICLIDLAVSCYVPVIEEHPLLRFCLVAMDDQDDEDEEDYEEDEDGDRDDDLGVSDSYKALIALLQNTLIVETPTINKDIWGQGYTPLYDYMLRWFSFCLCYVSSTELN